MDLFTSIKYLLSVLGNGHSKEEVPIPPKIEVPLIKDIITKPKLDLTLDTSYKWKGIVWHHSASPDKPLLEDWPAIVRYHTSYRIDGVIVTEEVFNERESKKQGHLFEKPWRDVGYHGGVELVNNIPVFHFGRPLTMTGAHAAVKNVSSIYNETHIGLCAIGNYDKMAPSKELWEFCLKTTRSFMASFDIDIDNILGHREVYDKLSVPRQKSCPGNLWDMDLFRSQL